MSRPSLGNANLQGGRGGGAGGRQQQGPRHSHAGSASNSPRPQHAAGQQQQQSATDAAANAALLKELKSLVSTPVKLTLSDDRIEAGLLWAYDAGMGVVALEQPKAALVALRQQDAGYPTSAASYPTAKLSGLKVAAQGGDAGGSRTTFQLISLRRIQRVERLSGGGDVLEAAVQALQAAKPTPVSGDVNVAAAEAREKAATAEAMKRAAKIGVGVSKLAQDVFDALNKTLPCRWTDRHIIVMDEFAISPDKYDTVTVPNVPLATLQALAEGKEVSGAPEDGRSQAMRWQRVTKVLDGERRKLQQA